MLAYAYRRTTAQTNAQMATVTLRVAMYALTISTVIALSACARHGGSKSTGQQWQAHMDAASTAFDARNLPQAENEARIALTIASSFPQYDNRRLRALSAVSKVCTEEAKYDEATALDRQALTLAKTSPSVDKPWVSTILHNLAMDYMQQRKFAEADRCLTELLAVNDSYLAPDDVARLPGLSAAGAPEWSDRRGRRATRSWSPRRARCR